jgi:hypothetical protein
MIYKYYEVRLHLRKGFSEIERGTMLSKLPSLRNMYIFEVMTCLPWTPPQVEGSYTFHQLGTHATLSIDDMIVLMSFIRLYHIFKLIREHSYLREPRAFDLCRFFNFTPKWAFVIKGIVKEHSYLLMAAWTISACVIGSYQLRVLERTTTEWRLGDVQHSLWLLSVTQLTLGYGDFIP